MLLIELVFGHWLRSNRIGRLNIPRGISRRYRVDGLYPHPMGEVTYTRDAFGLRGPYADPGAIDVLTIGGSATDQRFLGDGETWQDVLSRELAARGKPSIVVNAGVDGQSTYGHLRDFDWWFPRVPGLRARLWLFYLGVNDLHKDEGDDHDALVRRGGLQGTLEENSALSFLYRTLKGAWRARFVEGVSHRAIAFDALEWTRSPLVLDHAALVRGRLEGYEARLVALAERVRERGGIPVFVTQPSRRYKKVGGELFGTVRCPPFEGTRINGVDYYRLLRLLHERMLSVGGRIGAVTIDLEAEVDWEEGDFYDYTHHTPRGALKIGRHLAARLAALP